ncbi:hypothetical protein C3L33_22718, partial [Rhododendron williamsianum]
MSFPISPNPNTTTSNNAVAAFESFFQGWLVRQEHYLDQLLSSQQTSRQSRDSDLRELISRVLSHYQQYYEEKSKLANCNVFLVFSPPWFTPFERTFFWIAGFKPGLAFQVVGDTVGDDLTEDQKRRIYGSSDGGDQGGGEGAEGGAGKDSGEHCGAAGGAEGGDGRGAGTGGIFVADQDGGEGGGCAESGAECQVLGGSDSVAAADKGLGVAETRGETGLKWVVG